MADLAHCAVCGEFIEPEHTVGFRRDAATGTAQILHMECTADGVSRAQRVRGGNDRAEPGTWDRWNGEEGAQSLLDGFSDGM